MSKRCFNKKFSDVDRRILECDYKRYAPAEVPTNSTPPSQIYINVP